MGNEGTHQAGAAPGAGVAPAERVATCRYDETLAVVEGGERAFVYFQSERITFATAELPAGATSSRDPGHPGAHEVVYCVRGEVLLDVDDGGAAVRLTPGDAALVYEGVPHTVHNPGTSTAELVWSAAPSLGRPIVNTEREGAS